MADLKNIINVLVNQSGQLAGNVNMNNTLVVTNRQDSGLTIAKRTEAFIESGSVGQFFGTTSPEYDYALTYFATKPNPTNAGGRLIFGYWNFNGENTNATTATVTSIPLDESAVVAQLQQIADGSFDIDADGTGPFNLLNIDLRTVTSLQDVVDSIAPLLSAAYGGTMVLNADNSITVFSDIINSGLTSTLTFLSDGDNGTFIGSILRLTSTDGGELLQGAAGGFTPGGEAPATALAEIAEQTGYKGFTFIDAQFTDNDRTNIALYAQANDVLSYEVFSSPDDLLVDPFNIVWQVKLAGQTNYRMLYSKGNIRKMSASYMARAHTVNFNAENSTLTMQLKELSTLPEEYTQSEIDAAKAVGLDIYTTVKNVPALFTSGANDFTDNRYNLIALVDGVQTAGFNTLKGTGTKIPQTQAGIATLVDAYEKVLEQFVGAAYIAPGTWTSPDTFGDLDTFNRNIEANGYYVLAQKLSDQSQVDREARKAPVVQIAIKLAGAVHSSSVIINLNE